MKRIDLEQVKRFEHLLDEASGAIVIVPHVHPDGDALGSAFGLWRVLKNAGYQVKVVSPTKYPEFYHWMDGHGETIIFSHYPKQAERAFDSAKLVICVDFQQLSRIGDMKYLVENFKGKKVVIDHHPNPDIITDLLVSDSTFSSTAELLFSMLQLSKLADFIDRDAATSIFTGVMTDTGSFDYSVSNPNTFEVAAQLTRLGVNQLDVHSRVYDNFSADRMRLMGFCLSNRMVVFPEYHTAYMYITLEDQKTFNFKTGDNEGLVNIPLSIKGVVFSALFTEKDKYIKVSFRSRGSFAVNEMMEKYFNGGGHRNAAGGECYTSMQETLDQFVKLLPEFEADIKQSVEEMS